MRTGGTSGGNSNSGLPEGPGNVLQEPPDIALLEGLPDIVLEEPSDIAMPETNNVQQKGLHSQTATTATVAANLTIVVMRKRGPSLQ